MRVQYQVPLQQKLWDNIFGGTNEGGLRTVLSSLFDWIIALNYLILLAD